VVACYGDSGKSAAQWGRLAALQCRPPAEPTDDPEKLYVDLDAFEKVLATLPKRQQRLLVMRWEFALAYEEIAREGQYCRCVVRACGRCRKSWFLSLSGLSRNALISFCLDLRFN